jgi:uncharacterized protein YggE
MDRKLTVDVKSILIAGLVLLGLLVAYLIGSADDGPSTRAVAAEQKDQPARTVVMTGTGKASVVPDQLSFSVSVHITRPDVSDAMEQSNTTMAKVLASLKDYGVTKKEMQTTGLSIDPVYRYYNYAPPEITGYRVGQSARVTVKELKMAGKAISATVRAGGNAVRVSSISLGIGDREAVLAEARDRAVKQASDKAGQYADATGQKLGSVLSLKEVRATQPRDSYFRSGYELNGALDAAALPRSVPIRAGEEKLSVTVQVVWSFD